MRKRKFTKKTVVLLLIFLLIADMTGFIYLTAASTPYVGTTILQIGGGELICHVSSKLREELEIVNVIKITDKLNLETSILRSIGEVIYVGHGNPKGRKGRE